MYLIGLTLLIYFSSNSQVSDILSVQKRNGRTIKDFYEGSTITLQTRSGDYYDGPVAAIRHDSVFIRMYSVVRQMTVFGSYRFDTLHAYLVAVACADIHRISVYAHRGSLRDKLGILLMIGGAGYALLNLINGSLFDLPVTDKKNIRTLGISTGAFSAGFINHKFFSGNSFSGPKDKIVYIKLNR